VRRRRRARFASESAGKTRPPSRRGSVPADIEHVRRRSLRLPESFTNLFIAAGLAAAFYLYHRRADPLPTWAILFFILLPIAGFIVAAVAYLHAGDATGAPRERADAKSPTSAASDRARAGGDAIETSLLDTRDRFLAEMAALGRRANVNLGVGGGIALFGLGFLAFVVLRAEPAAAGASAFAQGYLPRLSLVVAIEFLAYFFLSLYRSNLAEIKYFQNELTNVEARMLALRVALDQKSDELTREVVSQLARTERNFLIEKGHTTVELERARLEGEGAATLSRVIEALSAAKKP
jgi:hypothetical protein